MHNDTLKHGATLAGLGLAAGLIGALTMALGQRAEIVATGRKPSSTPAEAAEKLSGVDVPPAAEPPVSTAAHLAFGTALGLGLAALETAPVPARGPLFFAGAWGAGTALITALGLAEPPTRWGRAQLATDLAHHAVYAASATAAFFGLRRLVGR